MAFDEIDLSEIAPINFEGVTEEEREKILDALSKVVDPEVGVDVINLGLVYDVIRREDGVLHVKMTMTSMGCPFTPLILAEARKALEALGLFPGVEVELVWMPPWDMKTRLSALAKIAFGVFE